VKIGDHAQLVEALHRHQEDERYGGDFFHGSKILINLCHGAALTGIIKVTIHESMD
jgi:hypothetical protein